MGHITGKIDLKGVETEFAIYSGIGWQQWGGTQEQLGERVEILDALVAGLANESITLEDEEDDEDDDDEEEP